MGRGKLNKRFRRAMELAQHLNPHINMYDYEVPAVVAEGSVQALIFNCTEQVKVVVVCEGCCPGRCHHRKGTPKTLNKPHALKCRFCMVCADVSVPEGVKLPATTEQRFMAILWRLGVDQQYCYQVVPPFWKHPMDFYSLVHKHYVQVDGSCHWTDMFKKKCEEVLAADFEQANRAVEARAAVVRVHEVDLQHDGVVAATLAAAVDLVGVVLSPSYAGQWVPYQGQMMPYIQALLCASPNLTLTPLTSCTMHIHSR